MELEKNYNYSIRSIVLSRFNCEVTINNPLYLKLTVYFKKLYVVFLGTLILNVISGKRPSLIMQFSGHNIGIVPIGSYFLISKDFYTFLQKFILLFLGVNRDLLVNYCSYDGKKIFFPLLNDFNDLFELCTISNNVVANNDSQSYVLSFNSLGCSSFINEFIIRTYRLPVIVL